MGWDLASHARSLSDAELLTFNMYTYEFGTMPHPAPKLPRWMEGNALRSVHGRYDEFSSEHPRMERSSEAFYDYNFDVVFGDYGYVVWCYDKNLELPVAETMDVRRKIP